jgi:hypothetical protein
MLYNPLVDAIINWIKEQGGIAYWVWVFAVGVAGGISLAVWEKYGFMEARMLLGVSILFWTIGSIPIGFIEGYREKKKIEGSKK